MAQGYSNHVRIYIPHHLIFYPLIGIAMSVSTWFAFTDQANMRIWSAITLILLIIASLSFMLRQHYALMVQNRVVRLEMRFRYFLLTGERLELIEHDLTLSQIFALRFASEDELPELLKKAIAGKMTADEIKRSIRVWVPDTMRV